MFQALLSNQHHPESGVVTVPFPIPRNVNLGKLDYLAKRLDSFDDYEKTEFQGMASRLDFHGVDVFINLTFFCQEVTVVTDFNNPE